MKLRNGHYAATTEQHRYKGFDFYRITNTNPMLFIAYFTRLESHLPVWFTAQQLEFVADELGDGSYYILPLFLSTPTGPQEVGQMTINVNDGHNPTVVVNASWSRGDETYTVNEGVQCELLVNLDVQAKHEFFQ